MKIAFINKYQNKVYRGAETFVHELSKRLSKNHEVKVFTNVWPLLKNKYDLIIPTNGRLQSFVVRKIAWLTGAKVVISGQSGAGLDDRLNLYSFPDTFVALSRFQEEWAKKINPFVNVLKIANGVDLNEFSYIKRTNIKQKVILSVGAFTKEKRHDLTIKAVSKIEGVKLVLVGGGGDLKEEIRTLAENILPGRYEIKSVSPDKMPEVYRNASVLAFPSVPWESFGIVLVEAMASGLPVVATNDPIRKEIVSEAGILVDPTNSDEYAKALQKALDTNWGNKPRKQAEKFSWDTVAEQYENLFQRFSDKS